MQDTSVMNLRTRLWCSEKKKQRKTKKKQRKTKNKKKGSFSLSSETLNNGHTSVHIGNRIVINTNHLNTKGNFILMYV